MIQTQNKPYFDDFEVTKGFLKVLFKPELSVQTRELNQLQSILQNQIGILSDSIYKDGSVVKDGRLIFKNDVNYVKLENSYNGFQFAYELFKGRKVYGETTQLVASVFDGFNYDDNKPSTLYLNYLSSGVNQEKTFQEGEVLSLINEIYVSQITGKFEVNETIVGQTKGATAKIISIDNNKLSIVYFDEKRFDDNEIILGSISSAQCVYANGETEKYQIKVQSSENVSEPIGFGSFVILSSGIYYVDGYFVSVEPQQLILSEYETTVSAKVGFNREVEYIDATMDNSLYDNANGTPNENAPGADRLKLNLKLGYYNIFDEIPDQFIEIMRLDRSVETFNRSKDSQWSNIIDLLAKRTYDESGNYTVNPFIIDVQEFLDENGNNGIYSETYFGFNSQTEAINASIDVFGLQAPGASHLYNYKYYPLSDHNTFLQACRDRVCLGVNPGLAYVLGYEVDLQNRIYVPMLKARELGTDNNNLLNVVYGNYCLGKELNSLPNIHNYEDLSLIDASSNVIGSAKIRAVARDTDNSTNFRIYLIDVNMSEGHYFSQVKTASTSRGFSFSLVDSKLYNLDKNILVYQLPKSAVNSIDNASYFFEFQETGVVSGSSITISAPSSTVFYSPNYNDYILSVDSEIIPLTSGMLLVSGNQLVINLSSSHEGEAYSLVCPVNRNTSNIKTKSLTTSNINISNPSSSMTLTGVYDGYELVGVYDSENASTAATTSSTNVTSYYVMDNGQRDNYYDTVKINRIANTGSATGQLLVVLKHFIHGSGDYFASNSYNRQQIDYSDIPKYTSSDGTVYELKNCLDFRPTKTSNGLGDVTNPNILIPNSNFVSNITYYLPRIDLLEVDYLGKFKVKKGTSAVNPQTPVGDLNAMVLYQFDIPSYTEDINSIVKHFKENKRYTMRDIGLLDTRIGAVENYILLTQNEYDISNMPIIGLDGTERYKTGYIADNCVDHSYGEISNEHYKCAVDATSNTLRPSYKLHSVVFEKDNTGVNTVMEKNGKYMIPYTTVDVIQQNVGTSLVRMNENGLVSWEGNMLISPSVNNNYNNIDQSKQNFGGDVEYLTEFNAAIAETSNNLEYGNFFLNWLGVN